MSKKRVGLLAALVLGYSLGAGAANAAALIVLGDRPAEFRVEGSDALKREPNAPLSEIFQIRVDTPDVHPMAGTYRLEKGVLIFRPQFPLEPGVTYRALYRLGAETASKSFSIPKPAFSRTTEVAHLFPTRAVLPENTLKLYIHFSAPMSRGGALRWIRLTEDSGVEVKLPFLRLEEELWDPQLTRLTVLFDPGRIKRGLASLQEMGTSLREGHSYTLTIDAGWPDARGVPLKTGFTKNFLVGPADRTPLHLRNWHVTTPVAETRQPVMIEFPEPLDEALLKRVMRVSDTAGKPIDGAVSVEREETRWLFTPTKPWRSGPHEVKIPSLLEDIAGNKIDSPFDVDVLAHPEQQSQAKTYSLPFIVRAAPR